MALLADDALGHIGWLAEAAPGFREALLAAALPRHFEHDQLVTEAGTESLGLTGMRTGCAGILHAAAPPDTPIGHIVGPGYWSGQASFLSPLAMQVTLVARGPVEAAFVPRQALLALLADRGDYWRELGRLTLEHTLLATTIAGDLLIPNSRRRLAATLLRLSGCRWAGEARGELVIAQSELAAMANLSRHSVGPMLADFAELGLLERHYRGVVLNDCIGLRVIADSD